MPGKKYLLIVALFAVVAAFSGYHRAGMSNANDQEPKAGGGDDLAKLGKARRDAAEKAYKAQFKHAADPLFSDLLYQLSVRWLKAQLDLAEKKEGRITSYKDHLQRMKEWEKAYVNRAAPDSDVFVIIRSFQREAEYWLVKEQTAKK